METIYFVALELVSHDMIVLELWREPRNDMLEPAIAYIFAFIPCAVSKTSYNPPIKVAAFRQPLLTISTCDLEQAIEKRLEIMGVCMRPCL